MSETCPLCGKNKINNPLFCDSCSRKIKNEYEVPFPGEKKVSSSNKSQEQKERYAKSGKTKKSKTGLVLLAVAIVVFLLVGGFYYYKYVLKVQNLERSAWEATVKENTKDAYLNYIATFPAGKHYANAQEHFLKLKGEEKTAWEHVKKSDNATELRDFIKHYPDNPFISLAKIRLDSLTWNATLNVNTVESYSDYMLQSQSGDFDGDYFAEAQKRYEMLFQSYPINSPELDSVKITIDGFFTALSSVNHAGITHYLAPVVSRFFDSGTAPRDKIAGELSIGSAKSQMPPIKFIPNMEAVCYEKMLNNHFNASVPMIKSYSKNGEKYEVAGYIVHLEMNPSYEIISIFETKPYVEAP